MPRIIFWNVNKKDLTPYICSIANTTNADVIVLVEPPNDVPAQKLLQELQNQVSSMFYYPEIIKQKLRFQCFSKNRQLNLSEVYAGYRISVRKFQVANHETLLMLVHGVDARTHDAHKRQEFAGELADEIRLLHEQFHTKKIILLGDFNMNPFDAGMHSASGLNAMMTKDCIKRGVRTYHEKKYEFYYNPMWSLFGDLTVGPAGTIYDMSPQGIYGWSMFDQVIIHHSLVDTFENVKILMEANNMTLATNLGRPDKENVSDHFPIQVDFKEQ